LYCDTFDAAIQGLTPISVMHTTWRVGLGLAVLASLAQAPPKDPLARARVFYNAEQYDQAIEAATEAQRSPKLANVAAVVLARAHLERFRAASARGEQAPIDVSAARDLLKTVDTSTLDARDRLEFLTGLGESLYLEDQADGPPLYGAAAAVFEVALASVDAVNPDSRESLFEWWAGSLDHQAQQAPDAERRTIYARLLDRAEQELARRDLSPAGLYWVAASARGVDDVERAWGAAVAGWIRAGALGVKGVRLRDDLDRLVTQAILPERARQMTPVGDAHPMQTVLQAQWDEIKKKWEK
jgi:hypothetical protein